MSKPRVTAVFRKIDHGGDALFARIKELGANPPSLKVGIFADEKTGGQVRDGGLTNVQIAAIHEFGAPEAGIPERSFIRSTFDAQRAKYGAILKKLLPRVLEGKLDVVAMFDLIGQQIVSDINHKVRVEGVPPPLKPATIARKGSSRALIDTGRMLAALTWTVLTGNRKVS